jgi:cytochrome P450
VIPAAGWSLLYVLADSSLTTKIRAEIECAFSSKSPDSVDIAKLHACPLLNSIVSEVLRLNVAVMINRVHINPSSLSPSLLLKLLIECSLTQTSVIPDLKFGNYILEEGKLILSSIYFSHRDISIWNEGCTLLNGQKEHPLDTFWAERFLIYADDPFSGPVKTPSTPSPPSTPIIDTKTPTPVTTSLISDGQQPKFSLDGLKGVYIPFGGGTNMCPSRHYAKNEMLLVVAMLLWAFDFELLDLNGVKKTKASMSAFPTGTLSPDRENAVRMRRRHG